MSLGTLHIHLVDKNGVGIPGMVAATRSGSTKSCTASGGMCVIQLEKGNWTLYARSSSGEQESGLITKQVTDNAYVTIRLRPRTQTGTSSAQTDKNVSAHMSKSSTRSHQMGRIRLGGTTMSKTNCRWVQITPEEVPSYFLVTGGNTVDFNVMDPVTDVANGPIAEEKLLAAIDALSKDIVAQGEDEADATAIISSSTLHIGSYASVNYAFFDTPNGVFVFKEKCGVMAFLPYVLGGAVVLGIAGFSFGYAKKLHDGTHSKSSALAGATVGMLVGMAGGYAVGTKIA